MGRGEHPRQGLKSILHYVLALRFGKGCKPQLFQNVRIKCKRLAFSANA